MNLKKHMVLIVGGTISLVLIVVALVLLFRFHAAFKKVNDELQSSMNRLASLRQRDPYPSQANVQKMRDQAAALQGQFTNFYARLMQGQIEPEKMEPAQFPLLLERTIRKLLEQAASSNTRLPVRFAFGFDRYTKGELPSTSDIPRLVIQVKEVDELCKLLYKSKISEITTITRDVFEQGGSAAPAQDSGVGLRRRGMAAPDPNAPSATGFQHQPDAGEEAGLYSREHYTLAFMSNDTAIWDVLNAMARSRMCVIVTKLELLNSSKTIKKGVDILPAEAAAASAGGEAPAVGKDTATSREQRIVAGREPVQVTLEVDVYRFAAEPKEEANP